MGQFEDDQNEKRREALMGLGASREYAEQRFPMTIHDEVVVGIDQPSPFIDYIGLLPKRDVMSSDRVKAAVRELKRLAEEHPAEVTISGRIQDSDSCASPQQHASYRMGVKFVAPQPSEADRKLWESLRDAEVRIAEAHSTPRDLLFGVDAGKPVSGLRAALTQSRQLTKEEAEESMKKFIARGTQSGRISAKQENRTNPPRTSMGCLTHPSECSLCEYETPKMRHLGVFEKEGEDVVILKDAPRVVLVDDFWVLKGLTSPTDIRLRKTSVDLVRSLVSEQSHSEIICLLETEMAGVLTDVLRRELKVGDENGFELREGDRVVVISQNGKLFDTWLLDIVLPRRGQP